MKWLPFDSLAPLRNPLTDRFLPDGSSSNLETNVVYSFLVRMESVLNGIGVNPADEATRFLYTHTAFALEQYLVEKRDFPRPSKVRADIKKTIKSLQSAEKAIEKLKRHLLTVERGPTADFLTNIFPGDASHAAAMDHATLQIIRETWAYSLSPRANASASTKMGKSLKELRIFLATTLKQIPDDKNEFARRRLGLRLAKIWNVITGQVPASYNDNQLDQRDAGLPLGDVKAIPKGQFPAYLNEAILLLGGQDCDLVAGKIPQKFFDHAVADFRAVTQAEQKKVG